MISKSQLISPYNESVLDFLINEIFIEKVYQLKSISKPKLILDIGANIGLASLYFSKMYPNAKIISYEPDPSMEHYFEHNIQSDNIQFINKGLSNKNGKQLLFKPLENDQALPISSFYKNNYTPKAIDVVVENSADVFMNFENIDICKIDVEGEESNIIDALLAGNRLRSVSHWLIEYHSWINQKYNLEEFSKIFESHGYHVSKIKETKNHQLLIGNTCLFHIWENI